MLRVLSNPSNHMSNFFERAEGFSDPVPQARELEKMHR